MKKFNGKPIMNAAVIFNPSTKDGKDLGSLEVKTDPEGKATIDVIPTGSIVRVQVIANGFATFADDYVITESSREIAVAMISSAGAGSRPTRTTQARPPPAKRVCRNPIPHHTAAGREACRQAASSTTTPPAQNAPNQ